MWANLKGGELANLCVQSTEQVISLAQLGLIRIRRDDRLPLAFLAHAGLAYEPAITQKREDQNSRWAPEDECSFRRMTEIGSRQVKS